MNNGLHKLTDDDVRKMREFFKVKRFSQRQLTAIFKISQTAVRFVLHGITWKHIT